MTRLFTDIPDSILLTIHAITFPTYRDIIGSQPFVSQMNLAQVAESLHTRALKSRRTNGWSGNRLEQYEAVRTA